MKQVVDFLSAYTRSLVSDRAFYNKFKKLWGYGKLYNPIEGKVIEVFNSSFHIYPRHEEGSEARKRVDDFLKLIGATEEVDKFYKSPGKVRRVWFYFKRDSARLITSSEEYKDRLEELASPNRYIDELNNVYPTNVTKTVYMFIQFKSDVYISTLDNYTDDNSFADTLYTNWDIVLSKEVASLFPVKSSDEEYSPKGIYNTSISVVAHIRDNSSKVYEDIANLSSVPNYDFDSSVASPYILLDSEGYFEVTRVDTIVTKDNSRFTNNYTVRYELKIKRLKHIPYNGILYNKIEVNNKDIVVNIPDGTTSSLTQSIGGNVQGKYKDNWGNYHNITLNSYYDVPNVMYGHNLSTSVGGEAPYHRKNKFGKLLQYILVSDSKSKGPSLLLIVGIIVTIALSIIFAPYLVPYISTAGVITAGSLALYFTLVTIAIVTFAYALKAVGAMTREEFLYYTTHTTKITTKFAQLLGILSIFTSGFTKLSQLGTEQATQHAAREGTKSILTKAYESILKYFKEEVFDVITNFTMKTVNLSIRVVSQLFKLWQNNKMANISNEINSLSEKVSERQSELEKENSTDPDYLIMLQAYMYDNNLEQLSLYDYDYLYEGTYNNVARRSFI